MSHEFAENDIGRFKETLCFSLRAVLLIMLPASFAPGDTRQADHNHPVRKSEFTSYSTGITQSALLFYALASCVRGCEACW